MSGSNGRPIAIAGGGIGGLATALALAKHNIASHVFERRETSNEDGAGIQLGPNATNVLDALGVADRLKRDAAAPDALSVHDGLTGRVLTRLPLGPWMANRHRAPYWTFHRHDLHRALLDAARQSPLISLGTSSEVVSFDERGTSVTSHLSTGTSYDAPALIAADGLWSKLRSLIAPSAVLAPTGKCAYRTIVSSNALPATLAANDVHIWLAPNMHAVHYPVRANREIALVVCVDQATHSGGWDGAAPRAWQASIPAEFPTDLRALLERAQNWRTWPLQSLVPLATWSTGRVTLLGDAAHPIQPFLAQGGALALEDAVTLAQFVARNAENIPLAFQSYEKNRKARAAHVASAAERNGRTYHLSGAMARARNAVLRTAPVSRLMSRYDWLYGWTAAKA